MRRGAIGLVLTLVATPAAASDFWVVSINRNDAGQVTSVAAIDQSRIESVSKTNKRAWAWIYITKFSRESGAGTFSVTLSEEDCQNHRSIDLSSVGYDLADGKTNGSWEQRDPNAWEFVTPQTIGELNHRFVCAAPGARGSSGAFPIQEEGVTAFVKRLIARSPAEPSH